MFFFVTAFMDEEIEKEEKKVKKKRKKEKITLRQNDLKAKP